MSFGIIFSREKSPRLRINRYSIYLVLILFVPSDSAASTRRRVTVSEAGNDDSFNFGDTTKLILHDINDLRQQVLDEGEYLEDNKRHVETICRDFKYPVTTKLELTNRQEIIKKDSTAARFRRDEGQWINERRKSSVKIRKNDEEEVAVFVHEMLSMLEVDSNRKPGFYTGWIEQDTRNASRKSLTGNTLEQSGDRVIARFRRDDKAAPVTQNNSAKDYMSTYYAQRKAIMDKYKSQQREIMERLKRTKSIIAESKKLKESKKTDFGRSNATRDQSPVFLNSDISYQGKNSSTIFPNPSISSIADLSQTTIVPTAKTRILNTTILNVTKEQSLRNSDSFFNSSDYESGDYSTEFDLPNATLPPVNVTFDNFVNEKIDVIERPDVETLERDWPSESVNLIPENEVDSNLTEQSLIRQERDNDTIIFNLGGQLTNRSSKNESAFDQLEKMFLWEVPAGDEGNPRSDDDYKVKISNGISGDDRAENSSGSLDSLRFIVEIKSSPEVQVNKNIKNVQTSTTTYRNSTHEIIEVNGVVNSTKIINGATLDLPYLKNTNFTNATKPGEENGGGARESEWCEECPHDYRWGDCDGTLFYQHNIFLRNRGPSAIDAIFGMNVQGPVSITCVEAIRFNQTRGIVTLHSGGQGYDFTKLRIRGFEGEGFSYIMKVWGVANDEFIDGSNQAILTSNET